MVNFNPLNPRGRNPLGYNPNDVGQIVSGAPKRNGYDPLRGTIRTMDAFAAGDMYGRQQQLLLLDRQLSTNPEEEWLIGTLGEYKEPPEKNVKIENHLPSNAIDEGYGSDDGGYGSGDEGYRRTYDDELYS